MPNVSISQPGVCAPLKELDLRKASGPDGFPTAILKTSADVIYPLLSCIIQDTLDKGEMPSDFKTSTINPVFKKVQHSHPEKSRSIINDVSLLQNV